jgi:hypothetical protein
MRRTAVQTLFGKITCERTSLEGPITVEQTQRAESLGPRKDNAFSEVDTTPGFNRPAAWWLDWVSG